MLSVQKIEDDESFHNLRDEWNELLQNSAVNRPFLTWEWLFIWWHHFADDRKLAIFTVRKGGILIGLAPFVLRPRRFKRLLPFRAIEFLGTGNVGSDYLSVIVRNGFEYSALEEIRKQVNKSNLVLQLSHVERSSWIMDALITGFVEEGWRYSAVPECGSPYINLSNKTWDSYVSSLGASHRGNLRRRLRKLHQHFDVKFELISEEALRPDALRTLVRLHLQRWAQKGGSNALHTARLFEFHDDVTRLALAAGWLRLFLLKLDDKPVAAFYCMKYEDTFYYYQAGFDTEYSQYSVGLAGMGMLIREALKESVAEFDFLRGNEQYKYLWTKQERELVRLDLFLPYLRGAIYKQGMELREDAKRWVRLQG